MEVIKEVNLVAVAVAEETISIRVVVTLSVAEEDDFKVCVPTFVAKF